MPAAVRGTTGRGERSKDAILASARRHFMTHGYERTTIRAVAADAPADPAMVIRYFGSKQALFRAASDVDLHLPDLSKVRPEHAGCRLMEHFVWLWDDEERDDRLKFLLRASVTHPQAADLMRAAFEEQIFATVLNVAPDHALKRAVLVATQIIGLAYCRHIIALEPLASTSAAELKRDFAPQIQRALFGPIRDG